MVDSRANLSGVGIEVSLKLADKRFNNFRTNAGDDVDIPGNPPEAVNRTGARSTDHVVDFQKVERLKKTDKAGGGIYH